MQQITVPPREVPAHDTTKREARTLIGNHEKPERRNQQDLSPSLTSGNPRQTADQATNEKPRTPQKAAPTQHNLKRRNSEAAIELPNLNRVFDP